MYSSYCDSSYGNHHSHRNHSHGRAVPQPFYPTPWSCMGNPDPVRTNKAPAGSKLEFQTLPYCSSSMYTADMHALSGFNQAPNSMAFSHHPQGYSKYMFSGGHIEKAPYTEPVQYHRSYNNHHHQRPEIHELSRINFKGLSSKYYAPMAEPISPPEAPKASPVNKFQLSSSDWTNPSGSVSKEHISKKAEIAQHEEDKKPDAMEALCMLDFYLSSIRQDKSQDIATDSKSWTCSSPHTRAKYINTDTMLPPPAPKLCAPTHRPKLWAPLAQSSQLKLPSPPPVLRHLPVDQFPSQSLTKEAFKKSLQPLQHWTPKQHCSQYTSQCNPKCPLEGREEGSSSGEHEYCHASSGYGGSEEVSDNASPQYSVWGKMGTDLTRKVG